MIIREDKYYIYSSFSHKSFIYKKKYIKIFMFFLNVDNYTL